MGSAAGTTRVEGGKRSLRSILAATTGALVLLLAWPALASAATRYAEPGGDGPAAACLQTDPCDIEDAVEDASVADGDVVIVTAGSYDLGTGSVDIADGITVRGPAPGQRPTISSATGTGTGTITTTNIDAEIRDLDLINTSTIQTQPDAALYFGGGATIERVSARAPSGFAGCRLVSSAPSPPATIRDSVCSAGGPNGTGLVVDTSAAGATAEIVAYNVTAVSANAPGLRALAFRTNTEARITAYNTIALGDNSCSTCYDVTAENVGAGSVASATMFNSNFDSSGTSGDNSTVTPAGSAGNQTALPVFVDAADGNYHQALSSPTIDAGDANSSGDPGDLGPFDIDGEARIQAAVDIGADEVPDGDGDGVADANDACPTQAASTPDGCPAQPPAPMPNPTPTPTTPNADTEITDLDTTAKKTQKQKGKIKIKVSVGAQEAISVKGTGSIEVKGQKKGYKLKPVTKQVESGERTILRLKLKKSKDQKKVKQAIKRYKKAPRKQKPKLAVKAPVKVVATDDAGNVETEKRVVRLR